MRFLCRSAADALAQQAGAALLPRVGVEASAGSVQQSKTMGIPPDFVPDGIQDTGHVAATFAFDLDLWGKGRAALAAATSEAEAARVDEAQARLMLTTGIAAAYRSEEPSELQSLMRTSYAVLCLNKQKHTH